LTSTLEQVARVPVPVQPVEQVARSKLLPVQVARVIPPMPPELVARLTLPQGPVEPEARQGMRESVAQWTLTQVPVARVVQVQAKLAEQVEM
jgi:hypothetical protein